MDFSLVENIDQHSLDTASRQLWEALEPEIAYLSEEDKQVVELAFIQMVEAHGEQRRKSGDFYIIHPVAACAVLARMKLDRDTLAGALLHDVPEDTEVSLRDLEKQFNKEIVFLVSGVTKLSVIKYQGEDQYAENLRRMFIAMSRDLRVIFIKLADRIHNLSTLHALPEHKARRIAMESLDIYAPIAERLGIGNLKDEIENIAFPYVYPEEYKKLLSLSDTEYKRRRKYTDKLVRRIKKVLETEEVPYTDVYGRAKRYYSLYKKMEESQKSVDEIYDLIAFRIITDSVENCYEILSVLHQDFTPMEERVKDYISLPKPNGYQSLHTTLTDTQTGITFEAQIRTQEMHEYAEYGVAAHWAYKQNGNHSPQTFLDVNHLKWIQELVHLGKEELSEEEYLQNVKLDLYQDEIFVLTPKGDAINLPEGATPLDFAYRIHGEVGHHASMAKVNGQPVKLSHTLHNGDLVEIITDRKKQPRRDWLQWVKTRGARHDIRVALRKQGVDI